MLVIGIAGGSGSGKTTVVKKIVDRLPDCEVTILPQDNYYKDNSHLELEERRKINFDHPDSIEWDLMIKHTKELKKGNSIDLPIYSYLTCTRSEDTIKVEPKKILIVEGILVLNNQGLRDLMDLKIFVDTDADDRLIRIINRDIVERGRSVDLTVKRYKESVKPMHNQFIEPSKRLADIIVPKGGKNLIAIEILTQYINSVV